MAYVHGYDEQANLRLQDQADALRELLHADTRYPAGSRVLEAGCGVGSQTVTLARNSPRARFVSVDVSAASLAEARRRVEAAGLGNVEFRQADIFALPFEPASFDHVFVCFVFEHLARPVEALRLLRELLDQGARVDGVGIQGHWVLDQVPFEDIEQAIAEYAGLGLKVMFTELDLDVVERPDCSADLDVQRARIVPPTGGWSPATARVSLRSTCSGRSRCSS